MEEVETLPTVEYSADGSGGDVLEMRDKTDGGSGETGGVRSDLDGGGLGPSPAAPGGGGGLDEPLLPPKDECGDCGGPTWANLRGASCSICLDDYAPGERVRVLPCGHTFHGGCIFPWLTERSPTCPLCKAMFEAVPNEADEDEEARETSAADDEASTDGDGGATPPASSPDDRRRRREERERAREER